MKDKVEKTKKFVEPSLKESELRYRRLFEAAQDGILILDARTGAITDVNPFLIDMLGYSRDEFVDKKLWEVGAFRDIQASKNAFETLQNEKYVRYEDLPLKAKDGHLIQVEFVSNVYSVNSDKVIQCNIRNINDRKQVEEKARESQEIYRGAMEAAGLTPYLIDYKTKQFNYIGNNIFKLTGYSAEEFTPALLKEIVQESNVWQLGSDGLKIEEAQKKFLAGKIEQWRSDLRIRVRSGEERWISDISIPIREENGNVTSSIGVFQDMNERRLMEERLRMSEARYKLLFEFAPLAINITSGAEIIYANPAYLKMFGFSTLDDLRSVAPLELFVPEQRPRIMENIQRRAQGLPAPDQYETEVLRQDGSRFQVLMNLTRTTFEDRTVTVGFIVDITERKQAEDVLLRQAQILEQVHGGIVTTDLNGLIMSWNSGAEKMFGYLSEEALGKPISLVYPQDQIAILAEEVQPQVRKKGWHETELRFRKKSGEEFPVHITLAELKDANGEMIGIVGSAIDITERKRAEEKLAASEAELRTLFASMTDAVMVLDADGRYVRIATTNPINLYHSPDEMFGKTVHEILPKEQADYIIAKTREAIQTGRVVTAEYSLKMGGKEIWFSCNATRLSENTAIWVAHDFTERKHAEDVLLYRAEIMNQVREAIVVTDLEGLITEWNLGAETMFGYSAGEVVGKPISLIYEEFQVAFITEEIQPQVSQQGWNETETRLRKKSGQAFPAHLLLTALKDSKGQIIGFAGSALDITERKQAEQAIHQHFVELATLYASGMALSRLLSPKEIGQKLIELMSSKMNWHHITIRLYHSEDESLELLDFNLPDSRSTAESQAIEQRFKTIISKAGDGLSGWAVQHQQVVRVADLSHDPRYIEVEPGLLSGLYVPLKVEERVVGVISVESETLDAFSDADEQLAATLANQAAIALENGRLHEETLHQVAQLQALHIIDETIAQSFDQRLMLDVLLTQTLSQLDVEAAAIFRIQFHHQQALEYVAGKGFLTHIVEMASLKLGNSIAGEAVAETEVGPCLRA